MVLDVGCGGAPYFKYMSKSASKGQLRRVVALEPNIFMHKGILKQAEKFLHGVKVDVVGGKIANLVPTYAGKFDHIILGNVLCEVDDVEDAISTLRLLLRPGGRIFVCEHVLAEGGLLRHFQRLVSPWCVPR